MAEGPKKGGATLPDRLVPDPKNPPELSLLQGWLGASSEPKHRRLYLDPELSQSLEIPEDAIVHTQDIPPEVSPLGGTWVWVKAEAAIKQGPGLERLYARFLRGQIQQDFLSGAGGGMVGAPPAAAAAAGVQPQIPPSFIACPTRPIICRPSVLTLCPTQSTLCPSQVVICQSSIVICRPTLTPACVPTNQIQCATRVCPSAVDACPSAPGWCGGEFTTLVTDPTIFQQGGFQQGGQFGGGLGFDPGAMAGGFVGAPGGGAGALQPNPSFFNCPSQTIICRPSVLTICQSRQIICQSQLIICQSQVIICNSSPVICRPTLNPQCPPSAFVQCPTRICPSAVDACPSAPGGCFDPTIFQGTIVQQPGGLQQPGGFQGGLGFDPGMAAGGMVGAPGGAGAAGPIGGGIALPPTNTIVCRPSVLTICPSQQFICPSQLTICPSHQFICPTRTPIACPHTLFPQHCIPTYPPHCFTQFCPTFATCPSAPVCGGGGGFPGGGGGFPGGGGGF